MIWEYQVTFWRADEMEADYNEPHDQEAAIRQLNDEIHDAVGQGIIAGVSRVESRKLADDYPAADTLPEVRR